MRDFSWMAVLVGWLCGFAQMAILSYGGDGNGHPVGVVDKALLTYLFTIVVQLYFLTRQLAKRKD